MAKYAAITVGKLARSIFLVCMICWCIVPCPAVQAEPQTITAVGEYSMGDGETMFVAKERAVEQAMRTASEQAGVYVESYSRVNNLVLTKDEINVLSRSVVKITQRQFDDPKYTGSGFIIRVTITALVDPDSIVELRKSMKEKLSVDSFKQMQLDYTKAQSQIEELKRQLQAAKTEQEKKQAISAITRSEQMFTASQWYDKGYTYATKRELDEAIAAYSQAIALNPQHYYAYLNRGIAYEAKNYSRKYAFDANNYDRAFADFSQAIAVDPDNGEAYYYRSSIYNSRGQKELAIADCSLAIARNPKSAKYYVERGRLQILGNDPQRDKAIADYSQAIAIDPTFSDAYLRRGHSYYALGQYDKAIADYSQVVTYSPQDSSGYYHVGRCYQLQGQYEQAISFFDQALALDPNDTEAKRAKEDCLLKIANKKQPLTAAQWMKEANALGKTAHTTFEIADKAIEYFGYAIEADPAYAPAYYERGSYYAIYNRKPDLAIVDYTKAIELGLQEQRVYYLRGIAYYHLGQFDSAIADFDKYLATNPTKWNASFAYEFRGNAYANKSQYEAAIANYSQVLVISPKHTSMYISRGKAYEKSGQYDLAIADAGSIFANKPGASEAAAAYTIRGNVFFAQGQYDKAIAEFDQAIASVKQFDDAHYGKALTCDKAGKNREAIEAYRFFVKNAGRQQPTAELTQKINHAKQRLAALGG